MSVQYLSRACFRSSQARFFCSSGSRLKKSKKELEQHQKEIMGRSLPKRRSLPGVRHVVLVASGKGGVGKSTTAVNLALGLASLDLQVGIFDADIYGPSVPIMLNIHDLKPLVNEKKMMVPLSNYGLKCMSMGFLVKDRESAVVWRGPMVMGATEKMLFQTDWAPLDWLVVDLPPGTGDIHLSIAQTLKVSGAVVVSTPQEVALVDARKGVAMFGKVDIPVMGIVENMNSFVCGHCGHETHVFGEGGAKRLADALGVPLLGSIPLDPEVMRASDAGVPISVSAPKSLSARCYRDIAQKLVKQIVV